MHKNVQNGTYLIVLHRARHAAMDKIHVSQSEMTVTE